MSLFLKKRKKITADLDNTAPVKRILDELPHKNKEAFAFYCRNLLQTKTDGFHCYIPGYPLNGFSEDWNGQLLSSYFQPFTYKCVPPKFITDIRHADKTDPVSDYMKKKRDWKKCLTTARSSALIRRANEKLEKLNEDVVRCPKFIVTIANLLEKDPEPYFNFRYNWYYAGSGNLHLISYDGKDYILSAEFSTVYLRKFYKQGVTIESEHVASFECGEGNNVFEIACSSCQDHVIAFRTRNKIFISKITSDNDQIIIKKITVLDSDIPYTSISFDNFNTKVLNVCLIDKHLYLINTETLLGKKILLKGIIRNYVDNWNTVIAGKKAYYLHVTKKAICLYDKRTNQLLNPYTIVRNTVDEYNCNDITSAKQFVNSDYIYFGTDHHLFELDLRYYRSYKIEPVQRWTHGMQFPPLYLNKCNLDVNRDLVCMSSPWCEDMCVVPNYKKSGFVYNADGGVTIPYRPPSILSVLHEAREQLLCNELYKPINARLVTTINGTAMNEQGENFEILMHSALGDITRHTLVPDYNYPSVDDDSVQRLHEWSKSFEFKKKPFEITKIANFAKAWRRLHRVPDHVPVIKDMEMNLFDEDEIRKTFENGELDVEFKEAWLGREAEDAPTSITLACDESKEL
ncbi:uncharacterized protein LOC119839699 [Zerene cesonia]|uniref:uncharacterized protein LOC119839699 n=1 Tax=Zerene cesonia TaxID=33412 RepID=UPI0018E529EF|nr:uncharacterized protein LOC119839699 [Zerene cesonia]